MSQAKRNPWVGLAAQKLRDPKTEDDDTFNEQVISARLQERGLLTEADRKRYPRIEDYQREVLYNNGVVSDDEMKFIAPDAEPKPKPAPSRVMRFDGDWEQTPEGYRLIKRNIRYEDRE